MARAQHQEQNTAQWHEPSRPLQRESQVKATGPPWQCPPLHCKEIAKHHANAPLVALPNLHANCVCQLAPHACITVMPGTVVIVAKNNRVGKTPAGAPPIAQLQARSSQAVPRKRRFRPGAHYFLKVGCKLNCRP